MQIRKVNSGRVWNKVLEEPMREGVNMFTSWVNM